MCKREEYFCNMVIYLVWGKVSGKSVTWDLSFISVEAVERAEVQESKKLCADTSSAGDQLTDFRGKNVCLLCASVSEDMT